MDLGSFGLIAIFFTVLLYSLVFGLLGDMRAADSGIRLVSMVSPAIIGPMAAWLLMKRMG